MDDGKDADECEEAVDAGFVATACGIASIMLGITVALILPS